jgi:hypothetical protein
MAAFPFNQHPPSTRHTEKGKLIRATVLSSVEVSEKLFSGPKPWIQRRASIRGKACRRKNSETPLLCCYSVKYVEHGGPLFGEIKKTSHIISCRTNLFNVLYVLVYQNIEYNIME